MRIKEILVLHHSHLDVGYTHSQPVLWEMQREYLDQALEFLEQTADWPELSRPKWMCEVTAPVLKWLETAGIDAVSRFANLSHQGRLAIGALRYNLTPLNNAKQLARQLAPVADLRQRFGITLNTAIQHDVNGVPWPLSDLLLDHGIDLLAMGTNNHFGNPVSPRPGVFRWRTPSGRELLVMNGNHYTMLDQILQTWEGSLQAMRCGLDKYTEHLKTIEYPYDFLYLTTTNVPELWDNSPPNPHVARLIRQWNEAGNQPSIRYVTTEDLYARLQQIPSEQIPLLTGDWTDYWNFGCASTAEAVARSRAAKRALDIADHLATHPQPPAVKKIAAHARDLLDQFDEHTWGFWDTAGTSDAMRVQNHLKASLAIEARELADYLLTDALDSITRNPPRSETPPSHILFVNPAPIARSEYVRIPVAWRHHRPQLRSLRFAPALNTETETVGPIPIPAFGTKRILYSDLLPAKDDAGLHQGDRRTARAFRSFNNVKIDIAHKGDAFIESPTHRLAYAPETGRVLSLFDKTLNREILSNGEPYAFFDIVRERPDALVDGRREAFYERDLEREKVDATCWKNWRAVRERATRTLACRIERDTGSITLDRTLEAPGTARLRQRITLRADSPIIVLEAELDKTDCAEPEAIYFAMPLLLDAGWRCHFDTAGLAVALDDEQLPGACRNWLTVDSYVSLHSDKSGATLFCPDAPLVMAGDYHFGPPLDTVPRLPDPLLLAWATNNYWNTNFPLVQPGPLRLRYGFYTHGPFDAIAISALAATFATPILAHPLFG